MAWVALTDLKLDLGLDALDTRDDAVLQECLNAAIDFVERAHPNPAIFDGAYWDDAEWDTVTWDQVADVPADVKLGTVRLAGRWFARRKSPSALIEMGEFGAARVPSFDPDIERLLRVGRYRGPVFA